METKPQIIERVPSTLQKTEADYINSVTKAAKMDRKKAMEAMDSVLLKYGFSHNTNGCTPAQNLNPHV